MTKATKGSATPAIVTLPFEAVLSPHGRERLDAHEARMRARGEYEAAKAPLPHEAAFAATEAVRHADVIAAARAGVLSVDPSGVLVLDVTAVERMSGGDLRAIRTSLATIGGQLAAYRARSRDDGVSHSQGRKKSSNCFACGARIAYEASASR